MSGQLLFAEKMIQAGQEFCLAWVIVLQAASLTTENSTHCKGQQDEG